MSIDLDKLTLSQLIADPISAVDWDSISPADWNVLVQIAQVEKVGPLLYWRLAKSGKIGSLPDETRDFLRTLYASTWRQNYQILNEMEALVRQFDQADIPAVVLKGACFAVTIYPDIGLRPMGDLDLLVPKGKLNDAVRIAKSLGYRDLLTDASPGLRELLGHEVNLQKNDISQITLELHHSLVADKSFVYAVPVDWFWGQVELFRGSPQGRFGRLNMLTPTAQILYAASHAMLQHGGRNTSLLWFYDLDQLVRVYADRLDWDLLLSQAVKFNWGSALNAAFIQTKTYFNTPIPDHVIATLPDLTDRHQSLIDLLKIKPETHTLEEYQKVVSLNWYGRYRLVAALIFPSAAYMRWRYQLTSSLELPVYYLVRWWGIFLDSILTVVSLIRKAWPVNRFGSKSLPRQLRR